MQTEQEKCEMPAPPSGHQTSQSCGLHYIPGYSGELCIDGNLYMGKSFLSPEVSNVPSFITAPNSQLWCARFNGKGQNTNLRSPWSAPDSRCLPPKHENLSLDLQNSRPRQIRKSTCVTPALGGRVGACRDRQTLNTLASQPSQVNKLRGQWETLTQNLKMERKEKKTPNITSGPHMHPCVYTYIHTLKIIYTT